MTLLDRLSRRKAAFHFVEREDIAYAGDRELIALIAKWFEPNSAFSSLPDLLPVWHGSYLPFEAASRRWAIADVWTVLVGCPDATTRRALVAHVRRETPLGMFDHDAVADSLDASLVLAGFIAPSAYIRLSAEGRAPDRDTGLDVIGFVSEMEASIFHTMGVFSSDDDDAWGAGLLRLLSKSAGRRLSHVQAADGYESLLNQAFELFHMGSTGAAGLVAGVAYERLMRAALKGPDAAWLAARDAAGTHTTLNDIIGKVASRGGWDDTRLRRYQRLRNDLAHRLGDQTTGVRDPGELREEVDGLLRWLDRQHVDSSGLAHLYEVPRPPELSHRELFEEASALAEAAAASATTTEWQIADDWFEPFGHAWVTVRDPARPFPRWLLKEGLASPDRRGAHVSAPGLSLERNIAWAHAFATRLREAGHPADLAARPD